MTTKEKIKKQIDKMPNDVLEKVYRYIISLKTNTSKKKRFTLLISKGISMI